MKQPLKIGLTGGIGAGKSLVLELLRKKGVPVLQTDHLGHQLLSESAFSKSIVRHFGKEVLDGNRKVDRQKLSRAVFQDAAKRAQLNRLLHPEIIKRVEDWARRQARQSSRVPLVVEVPLLFESGLAGLFEGVVSVSAPLALRRRRLLKRGWDLAEIWRREKTQWSQAQKDQKADWVIFNRKGRKELKYAVNRWLENFTKDVVRSSSSVARKRPPKSFRRKRPVKGG